MIAFEITAPLNLSQHQYPSHYGISPPTIQRVMMTLHPYRVLLRVDLCLRSYTNPKIGKHANIHANNYSQSNGERTRSYQIDRPCYRGNCVGMASAISNTSMCSSTT